MKKIGFPISHKENENRRVIVPSDISNIKYPECLVFEKGYGDVLGLKDDDYINMGCQIADRDTVLNLEIICDPKIGDADYLDRLKLGATIFGWIHAVQNRDITNKLINNSLTAYAWEDMYYKGRHIFWRNNELAGEAAVMHSFQCHGIMPYNTKVAVIGKGNTARGAVKTLSMLGAEIVQYDRYTEDLLREEIAKYDVIVNCVLWDVKRNDHIINNSDLKRMKKGAMIVDVSCDKCGGIESSIPTTIEDPIYYVDGIAHYVVDHTPSLFFKTFTYENSKVITPYLNDLIEEQQNSVLEKALVVEKGKIIDNRINLFQAR